MTTPADELRTAAAQLRELATAASTISSGRPTARWHFKKHDHGHDSGYLYAENPDGPGVRLTPTVGLALVKLLEDVAELHEPNVCTKHEGCEPFGCQWCADESTPCADLRNALAVARAINGDRP